MLVSCLRAVAQRLGGREYDEFQAEQTREGRPGHRPYVVDLSWYQLIPRRKTHSRKSVDLYCTDTNVLSFCVQFQLISGIFP